MAQLKVFIFSILVLFAGMVYAQEQKPAETPQLTETQQMSLRIKELEAENAILRAQLAQAQFEISRSALQKEIDSIKIPGWNLERIDSRWVFVPVSTSQQK